MKKIASHKLATIIALVLCNIIINGIAASNELSDPIREIANNFPKSVQLKQGRAGTSLEFCPDNTCEAFTSKREISLDNFKDFAYLFLFFYSDYYVLDNWRHKESAISIVRQIVSKPQYQSCNKVDQKETIQCILINLSQKEKIKFFSIRYDENEKNIVERDLGIILSKAPKQRK